MIFFSSLFVFIGTVFVLLCSFVFFIIFCFLFPLYIELTFLSYTDPFRASTKQTNKNAKKKTVEVISIDFSMTHLLSLFFLLL